MAYLEVTTTRTTTPDPAALITTLRSVLSDATAGVARIDSNRFVVKKTTAFTAQDTAAAQSAIDTAPELTDARRAQNTIDGWPIELKALALTLLDQINVLRANDGLGAITPAQALAAIRAKAGTLS
jgi:hypothetical protein